MVKRSSEARDEGTRPRLSDEEWVHLARTERAAGKGRGLRLPRTLPQMLTESRSSPRSRYRRADWIGKLAGQRANPGTVLDELSRRVGRAPTEDALREAGVLLEELSRLPDGQSQIGRRLTQEAVDGATGSEGGGRVDQRSS